MKCSVDEGTNGEYLFLQSFFKLLNAIISKYLDKVSSLQKKRWNVSSLNLSIIVD